MKISKEEKVIRLLQYLKRYTDQHNPTSISRIEKYFLKHYGENYFGDRHTRQKMIQELVRVCNSDINGKILPKEEWKILYDDFVTIYGDGKKLTKRHQIVNLYYNQNFESYEIMDLLRCIENNQDLDDERKEVLIEKINKYMKNEYFGQRGFPPALRTRLEQEQKRKEAYSRYIVDQKLKAKDNEY